ncbi:peroxisome membrane protein [Artomyces pyxidatus]|uniref:Peroxisome membrane protein n=1 Tax=Artomyces pyxidatus TaxID=48021 RepID=A0ACB8TIM7_9AGAM|nr:peroxisome membrane protein [Artomyces pyxidatus]
MSSALARYETFLINNVSTISSLESTLRSVTWLLPGRFKDAELASEALSSSLNVLSLYHDTLLTKAIENTPKYKPLLPPTLHTRYTRAWADNHTRYRWAARVLELVRFVELLVEMGLRRKVSSKNRWRGIVVLEAIKAILKFTLLRITGRPLLSPPIPERDIDPATLPPPSTTSSPTLAPSSLAPSPPTTPDHLRNNHTPLPPHPLLTSPPATKQTSPIEDFLLSKALTTSSVKSPTSLIKPLATPKEWLSESIHILRPLIYVSLLSSERHSNRPLVVSLALELLSRNLRRIPTNSSSLERSEYARRDRDLLWYLVRGSIWETWTRPKLEAFVDSTSNIPVIGLLGAFLRDWMPLIDEYYYYTSS